MQFQEPDLGAVKPLGLENAQQDFVLWLDVAVIRGRSLFFQLGGRVVVLLKTDGRAAEKACRQHADPADGTESDRTALGKAHRDDGQHGWPEERFANAVDCDRKEAQNHAHRVAEEQQADCGDDGAAEQ